MHAELISIETDGIALDGLYYEPRQRPPVGAVMIFHGNCMNFYVGAARFLPPALTAMGLACLTYNRRGHDILSTRDSRQAEGAAFQTVEQMVADNRYAAQWLAGRGFEAPVLIGHSNGGMLAVQHCAQYPQTPALILLSAHAGGRDVIPNASRTGLLAGNQFSEIRARAQAMVNAGHGRDLLLLPGWWYVASAESFLDLCEGMPDLIRLAPQIRCPTLYLRGDQEPRELYPLEEFKARTAGPCDTLIVEDCDHFYVGREATVTAAVADWLAVALGKAS